MDRRENRLSPIVRNIITSGMGEKHNIEFIRKVMLLNIISITGVIFTASFGIVAFVQGNAALGSIDHFVALLLLLNLLYLRRSHNYEFACSFGIATAGILFFYLLITGGVNNTAHVWYFTFPLFSSFLLGSKKGGLATILLLILAILFFAVDLDSPYLANYSKDFTLRFIPSFFVVFIFSYAFEFSRERAEERLVSKNDELNRTITELKEIDIRLRKAQEELEKKVRERTAELSKANIELKHEIEVRERAEHERLKLETQLAHSQKMEAIGTLAGGIAHDFNNLLAVIQGQSSFIARDLGEDNYYKHNLSDIQTALDRGVSLTRQLLGFAEKGKYEVKPIDLNEAVRKSSRMFGRTRKELKISCKYEKNIWAVEADEGQIEQVLLNLYVNAAQAMPRGGELHLKTENVILTKVYVRRYNENPGRYVKIVVSDTGEGMDEETQKKVFDPFFTTRAPGQGSGLGLASAYGIVKNHDGIIEVSSSKGKGTTFTIHLPASRKKVAKKKAEKTEEPTKGKETIILIDDEALIIRAALANLVSLGYEVLTAESGEEALSIYEENKDRIDLVILDMIMPEMGGGETYDRLKEIDPEVKVILSSGYSIDGQAQEILDRGCNGFIQKPFKPSEFSQKIREILSEE